MKWSHVSVAFGLTLVLTPISFGDDLPTSGSLKAVHLFTVPNYCEGVVFDHDGKGYTSHSDTITQFTIDGKHRTWAKTGAPNGHKILADGTHLVCDASHHAVLHLSATGKQLEPVSTECNGKPLRGPNDLSLDTRNGGFYFTDPGGSGINNLIGTVALRRQSWQDAFDRRQACLSQRHRAATRWQGAVGCREPKESNPDL